MVNNETYVKYLHGIDGSRVLAGDLTHLEHLAIATLAKHLAQFKVLRTCLLLVFIDHMLGQENSLVVIRAGKGLKWLILNIGESVKALEEGLVYEMEGG